MANSEIKHKIFEESKAGFKEVALEVFRIQYTNNKVYSDFVDQLSIDVKSVNELSDIPFLPIRFFKSHTVICGEREGQVTFESSGTTGMVSSKHHVANPDLYKESFLRSFEMFYGFPNDYCILGLLPSYLERKNSSLVYMVEELINLSDDPDSGFYLYDFGKLSETIQKKEIEGKKTLLIGVTFALLDFAEQHPMDLKNAIIMETGGMKGKRDEMVRADLHEKLKISFQVASIHSEYGMTELLSQAYSKGNGVFETPPWMKVMVREEDDPLCLSNIGKGAINVIDLANIYSCSFIATDDYGEVYENGKFSIIGRMDNSDIRGCSLMVV